MDNFNFVFDKLCDRLKSGCILEDTSVYFSSLKSDSERFKLCLTVLQDAKLLPFLQTSNKKSCTNSEKYRNEGNRAFLKKDDLQALEYYSKSIANAPEGTQEMSLAFANRSAVSFSLNNFEDCIVDIDRALLGHYPENLKYKLFERKGNCLHSTGRLKAGNKCFYEALELISKSNLSESKIKSCVEVLKEKVAEIECSLKEDGNIINTVNTNNARNNDVKLQFTSSNCNNKCDIPLLTYPASEDIVGACDAIRIEFIKDMGRHIVANRDIKSGDVLVIERPYASVLLPTAYNLYCFNCFKRCHTLISCIHCTKVLFCSEICRERCWTDSHAVECPILEQLINLGCTKLELLAVRTLLVVTKADKISSLKEKIKHIEENYYKNVCDEKLKGFDENNQYRSTNYATVHWLATNSHLRTNADLFRRTCFACCIVHCIDSLSDYFKANQSFSDSVHFNSEYSEEYVENKCIAGTLLLKYLQIMPCNAHEVSEMCLTKRSNSCGVDGNSAVVTYNSVEIGGALYPLLSLINHSCDPNVVRHSHDGDTVVLTAIQAVRKGDQIFDNYGYHHAVHDRQMRQTNLLSQYHFVCQCVACDQDWPRYHLLPDSDIIYKSPALKDKVTASSTEFRKLLKQTLEGTYSIENLRKLLDHLSLLQSAVERPWKEFSECQEAVKQTLSMLANHYTHFV